MRLKKKDFFNVKRRDLKLCSCDWLISSLVGVSEKKTRFFSLRMGMFYGNIIKWVC